MITSGAGWWLWSGISGASPMFTLNGQDLKERRQAMARQYQTHGERAVSLVENVLQSSGDVDGQDIRLMLAELNVPMYYVELNGDELAGPWLTKRAAEDYIDTHICERGVCDDAYDRVRQEYGISDADGNEIS